MSVTPRRSWPAGEGGASNQGSHAGDSQQHHQRHQSQGNMQPTGQQNNRQMGTTNTSHSNMSSGLSTSHPETPNKTGLQTQMKPTLPTPQQLQQQQQQQHRPLPTNIVNNLPASTNSLFSPPSATSIQQSMPMAIDIHQQQSNLFVNGQSEMNQSYSGINHGGLTLNNTKSESSVQASHYEFQSQMNDYDQQQMNSESLFNAIAVRELG